MRGFLVVCACLSLGPLGCGSTLGGAVHELELGNYPAALARLRRLEATSAGYDAADRARYALYRGLSHLAVGDAAAADRWLTYAKRAVDQRPGLLGPAERGRLLQARRSMGLMPGR